ncbi:hypothetical protein HK105_202185 [Polyrhizophydium stewartii]|uniref:Uncharacterized protein n=1 Tax=Polyrhizophydium stewartii TaxID=2732419 RepID=A0ABR4NFE8_9FUNG
MSEATQQHSGAAEQHHGPQSKPLAPPSSPPPRPPHAQRENGAPGVSPEPAPTPETATPRPAAIRRRCNVKLRKDLRARFQEPFGEFLLYLVLVARSFPVQLAAHVMSSQPLRRRQRIPSTAAPAAPSSTPATASLAGAAVVSRSAQASVDANTRGRGNAGDEPSRRTWTLWTTPAIFEAVHRIKDSLAHELAIPTFRTAEFFDALLCTQQALVAQGMAATFVTFRMALERHRLEASAPAAPASGTDPHGTAQAGTPQAPAALVAAEEFEATDWASLALLIRPSREHHPASIAGLVLSDSMSPGSADQGEMRAVRGMAPEQSRLPLLHDGFRAANASPPLPPLPPQPPQPAPPPELLLVKRTERDKGPGNEGQQQQQQQQPRAQHPVGGLPLDSQRTLLDDLVPGAVPTAAVAVAPPAPPPTAPPMPITLDAPAPLSELLMGTLFGPGGGHAAAGLPPAVSVPPLGSASLLAAGPQDPAPRHTVGAQPGMRRSAAAPEAIDLVVSPGAGSSSRVGEDRSAQALIVAQSLAVAMGVSGGRAEASGAEVIVADGHDPAPAPLVQAVLPAQEPADSALQDRDAVSGAGNGGGDSFGLPSSKRRKTEGRHNFKLAAGLRSHFVNRFDFAIEALVSLGETLRELPLSEARIQEVVSATPRGCGWTVWLSQQLFERVQAVKARLAPGLTNSELVALLLASRDEVAEFRARFMTPFDEYTEYLIETALHVPRANQPYTPEQLQGIIDMSPTGGSWTIWISSRVQQRFLECKRLIAPYATHAQFTLVLLELLKMRSNNSDPMLPSFAAFRIALHRNSTGELHIRWAISHVLRYPSPGTYDAHSSGFAAGQRLPYAMPMPVHQQQQSPHPSVQGLHGTLSNPLASIKTESGAFRIAASGTRLRQDDVEAPPVDLEHPAAKPSGPRVPGTMSIQGLIHSAYESDNEDGGGKALPAYPPEAAAHTIVQGAGVPSNDSFPKLFNIWDHERNVFVARRNKRRGSF